MAGRTYLANHDNTTIAATKPACAASDAKIIGLKLRRVRPESNSPVTHTAAAAIAIIIGPSIMISSA
jgi:hypothetical protein